MNNIYGDIFSAKSSFLAIFGAWGKVGINCFILITGYYMCKSNISLKKFLKFLLEVEFYKIIIYLIFCICGYISFNMYDFKMAILPITSIGNNFVGCFLIFYLLIPFINSLINNMSRKKHLTLIVILFFSYSILGNFEDIKITMNYLSLFLMIYLIVSYIRLYSIKFLENKKVCLLTNFSLIIICIGSIFVRMNIYKNQGVKQLYYHVNDSNKILAVLLSIAIFYLFKNIKMKNSKVINTIASSIFGVLLIHANSDVMRKFLWNDLLDVTKVYGNSLICVILHAIISVLVIFVVCISIDQIRICCIEKPFFKRASNKIDNIEKWLKRKIC